MSTPRLKRDGSQTHSLNRARRRDPNDHINGDPKLDSYSSPYTTGVTGQSGKVRMTERTTRDLGSLPHGPDALLSRLPPSLSSSLLLSFPVENFMSIMLCLLLISRDERSLCLSANSFLHSLGQSVGTFC